MAVSLAKNDKRISPWAKAARDEHLGNVEGGKIDDVTLLLVRVSKTQQEFVPI
jgi:hypothetical protein